MEDKFKVNDEEEYRRKRELEGWNIEETQQCPVCGSKRISHINTYQVIEEVNLSSGRRLNKINLHHLTPYGRVFNSYICRKCGWQSIQFDE